MGWVDSTDASFHGPGASLGAPRSVVLVRAFGFGFGRLSLTMVLFLSMVLSWSCLC